MNAQDILRAVEGDRTRSGTHMHILGSTGLGKSFFLEYLLREAVLSNRGFCFIDWHGTTYQRLLNFLTYIHPRREIVLLNPSEPEHVVGFNPFIDPGEDITTTVARRIDATIKPWGAKDTNQTPTLERTARYAYHFAIRAEETLPNAQYLLRFTHRYLLDYALSILRQPEDEYVREEIEELKLAKTPNQWGDKVLSTKNRFARFIGHSGLECFLGLKQGNINVRELVDRNAIILVNLARSGHLDTEPARVFASLLINEFREAAMRRAGTKKHFFLALDEFQEYITFDLSAMLDETRKGGVHLILAHQRLGHLERDRELRDAIFANAGVKAVFGGLPFESAAIMANEMFLDRINQRDVKETFYGQKVVGYDREFISTETTSESWGASESEGASADNADRETESQSKGASSSGSVTRGSQLVTTPIFEETVTSRSEWSREEKVSKLAAHLRNQPRQNCMIRLQNTEPEQFTVPTVQEHAMRPAAIEGYRVKVYKSANALKLEEARLTVQKSREDFLRRGRGRSRPKPAPTQPPEF